MSMARIITTAVWVLFLLGCERSGEAGRRGRAEGRRATADSVAGTPSDTSSRPIVLFLGTSLTAGLGVPADSNYPAFIRRRVDSLGLGWQVQNGGLSGETSAGALRRVPWLLQGPIRLLVIETGANDGLRGLDPDSTRANIAAIIARARAYDPTMTIVLAGMEAPPNLGAAYTGRFRGIFPGLARRERLPLIPFLLAGVGGVDSLNQPDGIHPTTAGHLVVADNVWVVVGPLLHRE